MKERAILFSSAMVRAILAATKTQTRRVVRGESDIPEPFRRCPYGVARDRLWVRETWAGDDCCGFVYRADHPDADLRRGDLDSGEQSIRAWHPSIFMPRAASRITLEIVSVRAERLQDITDEDARAEGIDPDAPIQGNINGKHGEIHCFGPDRGRNAFALLWDAINSKRAPWSSNPWVWVIAFKRVEPAAAGGGDGR